MATPETTTPSEIFHPKESSHCSERGCPFPAAQGEKLCAQHVQMFSFEATEDDEESLYKSSIEATEEDIASAIFYDESVSVKKRGIVPLDEWFENREWKKTLARAMSLNNSRKRHKRRRSAGLCVWCGVSKSSPGVTYCERCARKSYELNKARRDELHLAGVCFRCRRATGTGRLLCSNCVSQNRKARKSLLALRLCVVCRRPRNGTKVLCAACSEKHRLLLVQRYAKCRGSALCPSCGLPNTSSTVYCENCKRKAREWMRKIRARRRSNVPTSGEAVFAGGGTGTCRHCREKTEPGRKYCSACVRLCNSLSRRLKERRKRSGLCVRCGKERDTKYTRCSACAKIVNEYKRQLWRSKRIPAAIGGGMEEVKNENETETLHLHGGMRADSSAQKLCREKHTR